MGGVQVSRLESLKGQGREVIRVILTPGSVTEPVSLNKFTGGFQGQNCRCYHCILNTRPSEMQLLAFDRPFSRRVAGVGEGNSGYSWLRVRVAHCPGHLVGPGGDKHYGGAPKGAKPNKGLGSTKPEEFGKS